MARSAPRSSEASFLYTQDSVWKPAVRLNRKDLVPVHMWQRPTTSSYVGAGERSPGADVAAVSLIRGQMWRQ